MFEDKHLWFVTGKGGVGKSTIAAALGRTLADCGKTLVVETDSFSVMPEYLGAPDKEGVYRVDDQLFTTNLDPSECIVDTFYRFMPSKRIVKTLLNNRVSRRFFDAAPSVNEFVILDRIRDYIDGVKGDYEYVLVDLPASGHAVTFLSVPRLLSDMIRVGKVADRADKVDAMVNDVDKTGILAVCMPEQMPVNETIDLSNNLEETLGRTLDGVFLNLFHRAPFDLTYRDSFQAAYKGVTDESRRGALYGETTPIQKLFEGNALALDWHERDQSYVEKLHNGLDGTRVFQIPVVYQIEGETVVDNVAEHIDAIRGQQ